MKLYLPAPAFLPLAAGLLGACAEADGNAAFPSNPAKPPIEGVLTTEGVECPALRGDDGTLYTLAGDLGGFKPGDRVCVVPTYPEMSHCMQGTTVQVEWIGGGACPR